MATPVPSVPSYISTRYDSGGCANWYQERQDDIKESCADSLRAVRAFAHGYSSGMAMENLRRASAQLLQIC